MIGRNKLYSLSFIYYSSASLKKCNPYFNIRSLSSHVAGININKLRFDLDAAAIKTQTEDLLQKYKKVYDNIASVPKDNLHTWDNTIKPLCDLESFFDVSISNFIFPAHVSTDKEIRDASTEAEKIISAFVIEQSMREDVFQSVTEYAKKGDKLETQDKRYLDKIVREYKRNGIHLSEAERIKIKFLKTQISDLCIQFQKNLTENNEKVRLTADQLIGLPVRVFKQLKTELIEGKMYYNVNMKQDVIPALKYVKDVEARKILSKSFSSICMVENTPILQQIISLRHELANILGYANHSEFVLETRMAKNPKNVKDFYSKILPHLQSLTRKELDVMLDFKKKELGVSSDDKINDWDIYYYGRIVTEKLYSVENDKNIKEYFPLEKVVTSTLEIFQELLALHFKELSGVHVWHPEVRVFEVSDKDSSQIVGYFYLDLFSREGKYSAAATFSLQKGCELGDKNWQYPSSAMVCNFVRPLPNYPFLLKHAEIYVMHTLCSKAKYSRFAGTNTEQDFVECPSQMLENWCWDRDILKRLSSHYKNSQPLPDEVLDNMVAAKNANVGLTTLMKAFYGIFDQTVHSQSSSDIADLYNKLRNEIVLVEGIEGTNGSATFHYIVDGYDASYYGYLWSKEFSTLMFEVFKKKGIMNPEIGKLYREKVLSPGGSKDGYEILRDFLETDKMAT